MDAKTRQFTGAPFWMKVGGERDRAADDMPVEYKRKLLLQIHPIVERWRHFMAEIAPLFADFQRPASADGPQSGK